MKLDDFYYVGKITKKFSFRGEVIIFLDTDSPEFYHNIKKLFIKLNDVLTPFDISNVIPNKTNGDQDNDGVTGIIKSSLIVLYSKLSFNFFLLGE